MDHHRGNLSQYDGLILVDDDDGENTYGQNTSMYYKHSCHKIPTFLSTFTLKKKNCLFFVEEKILNIPLFSTDKRQVSYLEKDKKVEYFSKNLPKQVGNSPQSMRASVASQLRIRRKLSIFFAQCPQIQKVLSLPEMSKKNEL